MPALNALNERLRDDYIKDFDRRHRALEQDHREGRHRRSGCKLPHKAFNRKIGPLSRRRASIPDGTRRQRGRVERTAREWLPTASDRAFVASLMGRVVEPGKFANWIAPPARGINNQPVDFEYVRFN